MSKGDQIAGEFFSLGEILLDELISIQKDSKYDMSSSESIWDICEIEFATSFEAVFWDVPFSDSIVNNIIIEKMLETPKHIEYVSLLKRSYSIESNRAEAIVIKFMDELLYRMKDSDKIDSRFITEQVALFISELRREPVDWKIENWLVGIIMGSNKCKLHDKAFIRPVTTNETQSILSDAIYSDADLRLPQPSTVLEIIAKANSRSEIDPEIECIILALRLYNLGSVFGIRTSYSPNSFIKSRHTRANLEPEGPYSYKITENEYENLQKYVIMFIPILKIIINEEPSQKYAHIRIALHRFNDALLGSKSDEQRITLAITALEALLLDRQEREGLSRRLSQRLAALMNIFDFNPKNAYESTMRAYKIRSGFIHGSLVEDIDKSTLTNITKIMLNFLRICLQVFLQSLKHHKKKIIHLLDESLIQYLSIENLRTVFENVRILNKPEQSHH